MAQKKSAEETSNPSSEARLLVKARKLAASWSPEMRGYVILGIGLFLLLFSMGFFDFLKIIIGLIGLALIVMGTIKSKLIATVTAWFDKLSDKI